jgi:outer membrane lipoprotein-sorting protein
MWLLLVIVLCGCIIRADDAAVPLAADTVLAGLETQFAALQSVSSEFVQEKHLALFRDPIVLKGSMAIRKDGAFAWHVREPLRYSFLMQEGRLRQWDGETDKIQEIAVRSNPVFQTIFTQLRRWFSGRFSELRANYGVAIAGTNPLALRFTPQDATRKVIAGIVVVLRDDTRYIQRVTIEETSGDRTVITFTNTVLNSTIDASVWLLPPPQNKP